MLMYINVQDVSEFTVQTMETYSTNLFRNILLQSYEQIKEM